MPAVLWSVVARPWFLLVDTGIGVQFPNVVIIVLWLIPRTGGLTTLDLNPATGRFILPFVVVSSYWRWLLFLIARWVHTFDFPFASLFDPFTTWLAGRSRFRRALIRVPVFATWELVVDSLQTHDLNFWAFHAVADRDLVLVTVTLWLTRVVAFHSGRASLIRSAGVSWLPLSRGQSRSRLGIGS